MASIHQGAGQLVTSLERRISRLETEFNRAWWDSQVEVNEKTERRRAELELELRRVKGDPESLAAITAALDGDVHDPVLRRQLQVLRLSFTANQMEGSHRERIVALSSQIESDFAAYRPTFDGKQISDNEIDEILRTSDDVEQRRRAWQASKEVGAFVAPRVRELVRLRNEVAHELGYPDFYRMSLELQEIDEVWMFDLFDRVETTTGELFERWKAELDDRLRTRFGSENLYPWHYADPFFQALPRDGRVDLDPLLQEASAPELARKTFAAWDIDLTRVLELSDLYPREKKSQHAFCVDVDRSGKDVRILANVVPGEHWVEVMLHESGHAAYDICIDPQLPYLLRRAAHTFVTEAAAILSGRLVRDPEWLVTIAGIDRGEVARIEEQLRRATAAQSLLFARWCLVVAHFERALYEDPEADLDSRWWELVSRFQGLEAPPDRSAPDWAAKVHLAVAPAYYHNYLLGDLLAAQLAATARRDLGGIVGVPEAGRFLTDRLFRPGSLMRWDALVEEATGAPLAATDFTAMLEPLH